MPKHSLQAMAKVTNPCTSTNPTPYRFMEANDGIWRHWWLNNYFTYRDSGLVRMQASTCTDYKSEHPLGNTFHTSQRKSVVYSKPRSLVYCSTPGHYDYI